VIFLFLFCWWCQPGFADLVFPFSFSVFSRSLGWVLGLGEHNTIQLKLAFMGAFFICVSSLFVSMCDWLGQSVRESVCVCVARSLRVLLLLATSYS
jgi:hypothetical protein